jgi:hypothetical protein
MFAGAGQGGGVLANLSSSRVVLALPAELRGLPYRQRWAAPGKLVTGYGSLLTRAGRTVGVVALEPFSLTRVGAGG